MKNFLSGLMNYYLLAVFFLCILALIKYADAAEVYEKHIVCFYDERIVFDEKIALGRDKAKHPSQIIMIEHSARSVKYLADCYVDILRDGIPLAFDPRN